MIGAVLINTIILTLILSKDLRCLSKKHKHRKDNSAEGNTNLEEYNKKQFEKFPWPDGKIYFCYDYFTFNPNRLTELVTKIHYGLEKRTCLKFVEEDPRIMAKANMTYLQYTYSEALENCCLPFFNKPSGRRMVLITPMCAIRNEVGHAILHGFGFRHKKGSPFPEPLIKAVLYLNSTDCPDREAKMSAHWVDQ